MKEYIVHFVHVHVRFRLAELKALALTHANNGECQFRVKSYNDASPFAVIELADDTLAKRLIENSILIYDIYEFWGEGNNYNEVHRIIRNCIDEESGNAASRQTVITWKEEYYQASFWFSIITFQFKRNNEEKRAIVEAFSYLPLNGPVNAENPELVIGIMEEFKLEDKQLKRVLMGRWIGRSRRMELINKLTLKRRKYISTTSMDAELTLITANLIGARPGTLIYDPFMGTGGFPLACSEFGSFTLGSDIDGRIIRGKVTGSDIKRWGSVGVKDNFIQYGIAKRWIDAFVADLTNSPIRFPESGFLDAIVCDPPYGVREGVKVLGSNRQRGIHNPISHLTNSAQLNKDDYIPPKKPYSFNALIEQLFDFSAQSLRYNGRLAFWIPEENPTKGIISSIGYSSANTDTTTATISLPCHECFELLFSCTQSFNKWSRHLLIYRRREVQFELFRSNSNIRVCGTADDLNEFRRRYFQGFREDF